MLYQFFAVDEFKDLVDKDYEEILLFEIGANSDSFRDNKDIDEKANRTYNFGIRLTTISIIISVTLLITNNLYQPEKPATKVQILNKREMTSRPRVIPTVPPSKRERLNEGADNPRPAPQPKPQPQPNKGTANTA